jgi:signal recognition particle subunit SRP19
MLEEVTDQEIEDIDSMDFDPADFDPRNPFAKKSRAQTSATSTASSSSAVSKQPAIPQMSRTAGGIPILSSQSDMEQFKDWQVIYPVYFDATKSHAEGRRVSKNLAVENPLAQTLMEACKEIGVRTVFETSKTHPKDWANPGRIRVELKGGAPRKPIKNKRHFYILLAEYLGKHPSTDKTPLRSPLYAQMADAGQEAEIEPLAVPNGWKINSILPVNSRAVSGGEMNDDMMKQMQNQMFPGMNMPDVKPKKIKVRVGK